MKTGKFVVFEGTDGSGKTTQLQLLTTYFKKHHIPYATVDFPQYYKTFFGRWIARFLKGEFGDIEDVPPYIVSIPYAADRWQAKSYIEEQLYQGKIVVSNRYTGSNAVYQAAKLPRSERERFITWSYEMEYEAFGIPREDLVIFLYVPFTVSQRLIEQKPSRKYLNNGKKQDIHESNAILMQEVEKVYLEFCHTFPRWVKIDCVKNGDILTKEIIHGKIIDSLERKKILP